MTQVSIKIDGADSLERQRLRQRTGRMFTFPDGLDRLIVVSTWHWETYDRLQEEMWFSDEEFATCVYNITNEYRREALPFEVQLRFEFVGYIHTWSETPSANKR